MQLHHSNWIRIIKPQANLDKPPKNSKEPHSLQRSPLVLKRHQSTKHYKIPCKEDNIYPPRLDFLWNRQNQKNSSCGSRKNAESMDLWELRDIPDSKSWNFNTEKDLPKSPLLLACLQQSCLLSLAPIIKTFKQKLPYTQAAATAVTAAESQIFHLGLRAAKTPSIIIISSCTLSTPDLECAGP